MCTHNKWIITIESFCKVITCNLDILGNTIYVSTHTTVTLATAKAQILCSFCRRSMLMHHGKGFHFLWYLCPEPREL